MDIFTSDLISSAIDLCPSRVVSLVPSMTDSLISFGLGDRLVGVTDYCPVDEGLSGSPRRVGGPKTADVEAIVALKPDLVIANQEENSQAAVERLAEDDIPVWLSFPRTVIEAIGDLWTIVRIFNQERELAPRLTALERSLEWVRLATLDHAPLRYFCPIWWESEAGWWMTFNQNTYAHDVLKCCGGENVFSERERRYPLEADLGQQRAEDSRDRDVRYPRVMLSEVIDKAPDLILLPNEPYAFTVEHLQMMKELFADTPAISSNRIYLVDGRLITWHGIRIGEAIGSLPRYFQNS